MSKHLLSFLLSELATVRIICRNPNCGIVAEFPVAKLMNGRGVAETCKFCNADFNPLRWDTAPLRQLSKALADLAMIAEKTVDVEFIVPAKE